MVDNNLDIQTITAIGGFSNADKDRLAQLSPHLLPKIPEITDRFYEQLLANERTNVIVNGRVDQLKKKTHIAWITDLFSGDYGDTFLARQRHIGEVHVMAGIQPIFVAASMSFLRGILTDEVSLISPKLGIQAGAYIGAVLRLLDMCQYLIDSAYESERMRRLSEATSMRSALLENLISIKSKSA